MKKPAKNSILQKLRSWASGPITSWKTEGDEFEAVIDFPFLGSRITVYGDCNHEIKDDCFLAGKLRQT